MAKRNFNEFNSSNVSLNVDPVQLLVEQFKSHNLKYTKNSSLFPSNNPQKDYDNIINPQRPMNPLDIFSIKHVYDNNNSIDQYLYNKLITLLSASNGTRPGPSGSPMIERVGGGGASDAKIYRVRVADGKSIDSEYKSIFGNSKFPSKYIGKPDNEGYCFVLKESPVLLGHVYKSLNYKTGYERINQENLYDVINGYYLNRLLYDKNNPNETRPHTVSFMSLVDWSHVNKYSNTVGSDETNYYQLSMCDLGLRVQFKEFTKNYAQFGLFLIKLLHALHMAQCQYGFIHRDLHIGNVFYKQLNASSFGGKTHFLFDLPQLNPNNNDDNNTINVINAPDTTFSINISHISSTVVGDSSSLDWSYRFPLIIDYGRSRIQVPFRNAHNKMPTTYAFVPDSENPKNCQLNRMPTRILHAPMSRTENIDGNPIDVSSLRGIDEMAGLFDLSEFISIVKKDDGTDRLTNIIKMFRTNKTYFVTNNITNKNRKNDFSFSQTEYFYIEPDYSFDMMKYATECIVRITSSNYNHQYSLHHTNQTIFEFGPSLDIPKIFKANMFISQISIMIHSLSKSNIIKMTERTTTKGSARAYDELKGEIDKQSNNNDRYTSKVDAFLNTIPECGLDFDKLPTEMSKIDDFILNINDMNLFGNRKESGRSNKTDRRNYLNTIRTMFGLFDFDVDIDSSINNDNNDIDVIDYIITMLKKNDILSDEDSKMPYLPDIGCILYMIRYVQDHYVTISQKQDSLREWNSFASFLYILLSMTCIDELFKKDDLGNSKFNTINFNMFIIQFAYLSNKYNGVFNHGSCSYAKQYKIDVIKRHFVENTFSIGITEKFILFIIYRFIVKYEEYSKSLNQNNNAKNNATLIAILTWLFIISSQQWNYNIGIILNYSVNSTITDANNRISSNYMLNKSPNTNTLFERYARTMGYNKIRDRNGAGDFFEPNMNDRFFEPNMNDRNNGYLLGYNFVSEIIQFIGTKYKKRLIFELYHAKKTINDLYPGPSKMKNTKEKLKQYFDSMLDTYEAFDRQLQPISGNDSNMVFPQTNNPIFNTIKSNIYNKIPRSVHNKTCYDILSFIINANADVYGINTGNRNKLNSSVTDKFEYIGYFRDSFGDVGLPQQKSISNYVPISSCINQQPLIT